MGNKLIYSTLGKQESSRVLIESLVGKTITGVKVKKSLSMVVEQIEISLDSKETVIINLEDESNVSLLKEC